MAGQLEMTIQEKWCCSCWFQIFPKEKTPEKVWKIYLKSGPKKKVDRQKIYAKNERMANGTACELLNRNM